MHFVYPGYQASGKLAFSGQNRVDAAKAWHYQASGKIAATGSVRVDKATAWSHKTSGKLGKLTSGTTGPITQASAWRYLPAGRLFVNPNNLDRVAYGPFGLELPTCCCGGGSSTECCPNLLQLGLTGTTSSSCACLHNVTFSLGWDSGGGYWFGFFDPDDFGCSTGGQPFDFEFSCEAGAGFEGCENFTVFYSGCDGSGRVYAEPGCSCDPLNVVFDIGIPGASCCGGVGTFTLTITE